MCEKYLTVPKNYYQSGYFFHPAFLEKSEAALTGSLLTENVVFT